MERQPTKLPSNYALIRDIVYEVGRGVHLTANDIYRIARERRPAIGFATVHRGLTRLLTLGALAKIRTPDGDASWYEIPAPRHAHLHCTNCGDIVDLAYALPSRSLATIESKHGVRIATDSLVFGGTCAACTSGAE
jgi:Fe2+ or Zn2+ uptake regulation protein